MAGWDERAVLAANGVGNFQLSFPESKVEKRHAIVSGQGNGFIVAIVRVELRGCRCSEPSGVGTIDSTAD
jgi:hypothetical protein